MLKVLIELCLYITPTGVSWKTMIPVKFFVLFTFSIKFGMAHNSKDKLQRENDQNI